MQLLRDRLKVLVVDDMATSRGVLTSTLSKLGINKFTYESSVRDAVKALKTYRPDLVLCDMNMPEETGLDLLKALRSDPANQNTAFILVSGRPDANVISRGQVLGMNNFIAKPFTPEGLKICIEQVVGQI